MRAGKLDRLITLRTMAKSIGAEYGEAVETPVQLAEVWAEKMERSGREVYRASQVNAEVTTAFKIRWRDDVDPTVSVLFNGTTYDIVHIEELGRNVGLMLFCKARA